MPASIIIPVLTPIASVHFVSVYSDATIKDLLASAVKNDELKHDILGSLGDVGWGLQRVRKEKHDRLWDETELKTLTNGLHFCLKLNSPKRQIINTSRYFIRRSQYKHVCGNRK